MGFLFGHIRENIPQAFFNLGVFLLFAQYERRSPIYSFIFPPKSFTNGTLSSVCFKWGIQFQ
jgi:hypothetical protein